MPSLKLWQPYDRRAVHDVFEPDTVFTPQTGKWGISGIVRLQNEGDTVFFVTFGKSQGQHEFVEEISADGVLTWQSQPQQRLNFPTIQRLIHHDELTHNVYLFLRTVDGVPYRYLGRLGYLEHDPARDQPVYFTWQLLDWPPPDSVLSDLGIVVGAPAEPVTPLAPERDSLTKTAPPQAPHTSTGGKHTGRRKACLPGQDARNRRLGRAGEDLVLLWERKRLIGAGRPDLADRIVHVAEVEGDSAGYDVRSFKENGDDRHIEVKTTAGPASNGFFISPNEKEFSRKHAKTYVLMRLYGYRYETNSANYYEQAGFIEDSFKLTPSEFRAALLPTD